MIKAGKPRYFYRYLHLNDLKDRISFEKRMEEIFCNNSFYFPTLRETNDPFEGRFVVEEFDVKSQKYSSYLNTLMKNFNVDTKENQEKLLENINVYPEQTKKNVIENIYNLQSSILDSRILSFSSSRESIQMWAHYADSFRGICIQFDSSKHVNFFKNVEKVDYKYTFTTIDICSSPEEKAKIIQRTKHKGWKYEKEWRVFFYKTELSHFFVNSDAFSEIYFGPNIDKAKRKYLVQLLEKYKLNCKRYDLEIDKSRYKFNYLPNL